MKRLFTLTLLVLWTLSINAIEIDTTYIKKYDNKLLLKVSGNNRIEDYRINREGETYKLQPNSLNKIKLLFSHQWLSAGFSISPSFIQGHNNDEERKGESKMYNLSFNLNFDRWIQAYEFSYTEGFYLANTNDFVEDWDPERGDFIQFPDIKYFDVAGYTAYKFNPNYSVKSIDTQTERQLQSAGSFIPLLYYSYYIMDNPSVISENNSSQRTHNLETTLQLGYYYTYVIGKKWYFSPGITSGGGIVFTHLRKTENDIIEKENYTSPIFRTTGNLSFGFNSNKWAAGVNIVGFLELFPENKNTIIISNNQVSGQIFVSYRFNTPRLVRETVDKIPIPEL